jgi:tripartite-type tricarboxylate transporter receptor subunit TctC
LALFAPARTPEPLLNKIHDAVNKALASPDMKAKLTQTGGPEPFITDRKEFAARIREEDEQYGVLIKRIGLKLD